MCFWCCSVFTSGVNLHPPSPLSHLRLNLGVQTPALTFTWIKNLKLSCNGQNPLYHHLHYLTLQDRWQEMRNWKSWKRRGITLIYINSTHSTQCINKPRCPNNWLPGRWLKTPGSNNQRPFKHVHWYFASGAIFGLMLHCMKKLDDSGVWYSCKQSQGAIWMPDNTSAAEWISSLCFWRGTVHTSSTVGGVWLVHTLICMELL